MASTPYPRIAITARSDIAEKEHVLSEIVKIAEKAGAKISVDAERCDVPLLRHLPRYEELKDFDLIIILGGDGTILATIREMQNLTIPILGIHSGTLGFLTSIDTDAITNDLSPLLHGEGILDERQLLKIAVETNGSMQPIGHVLNEVVITQRGIARLLDLRTFINGKEFATYRADGLILATPTGSTAYSLAAGGAILHPDPEQHHIMITPINPHSFHQKSLIVPGDDDVAVDILTNDNTFHAIDAVLTMDGQITVSLQRGQKVHARSCDKHIRFLRKNDDSFYRRIREKLRWGEMLSLMPEP